MGTEWESAEKADDFITGFFSQARVQVGEPVDRSDSKITWKLKSNRLMVLHVNGTQTIWIFAPDEVTAQTAWEALNNNWSID